MRKTILFFFFVISALCGKAEGGGASDTLSVDLDKDSKKDIVIFDRDNGKIIVKLSSQQFKMVKSQVLEFDPIVARIEVTKSGF